MKPKILELIEKIDQIEELFYYPKEIPGFPSIEQIYNIQEFQIWIQELQFELQNIIEKTNDQFIKDTLEVVSVDFNGWNDRQYFNTIKSKLLVLEKNIDKYYPKSGMDGVDKKLSNKEPKIFISHSSEDKLYVEKIVDLLEFIGLDEKHLFCSSLPGYGIPVNENIFEYLLKQFQEYDLHVIFIHSHNYYKSAISLNEMGAAWVLRKKYTSFLLPGFNFEEMRGVVNSNKIAIKLDIDEYEVKEKLNWLYNIIIKEFGLVEKNNIVWEKKRDTFIQDIQQIGSKIQNSIFAQNTNLSNEAIKLLEIIAEDPSGEIIKISDLRGTYIQVGQRLMNETENYREFVRWESTLEELIFYGFLKQVDEKGTLFRMTNKGYSFLENK